MDQAMLDRINAATEAYARTVKDHSDAYAESQRIDQLSNDAFAKTSQCANAMDIARRDLMVALSDYAATLPPTPAQ